MQMGIAGEGNGLPDAAIVASMFSSSGGLHSQSLARSCSADDRVQAQKACDLSCIETSLSEFPNVRARSTPTPRPRRRVVMQGNGKMSRRSTRMAFDSIATNAT